MAHTNFRDSEDYNICPYDPLHRIQEKQWRVHLQKCSKEHPEVKVETCPFNSAHVVKREKFKLHLDYCKDKYRVALLQKARDAAANIQRLPLPEEIDYGHEGENWEDEISKRPQLGVPPEFLSGRGYLKDLAGMKKKDKKKYRERLNNEAAGIDISAEPFGVDDDSEMANLPPADGDANLPTVDIDAADDIDFPYVGLSKQSKPVGVSQKTTEMNGHHSPTLPAGRGRGMNLPKKEKPALPPGFLPISKPNPTPPQPKNNRRPGTVPIQHVINQSSGSTYIPGAGRGIRK